MNGLNRTVAIKRMIPEDVSRFQSEAGAIASITYPDKLLAAAVNSTLVAGENLTVGSTVGCRLRA